MRMRRKKNLDQRIAACGDLLVPSGGDMRGKWTEKSGDRPVFVEIGCGKGGFITKMAAQNPDCFFIAVEKYANVLVHAMESTARLALENVMFLNCDAARLGEFFAEGEASGVYINFPDPWPPQRYAKRRLTHRNMLAVIDRFLAPSGFIRLKTDDAHLFEFSLCELSQFGFEFLSVTLDLHGTDIPNIATEYEVRFAGMGMKILRLEAVRRDKKY